MANVTLSADTLGRALRGLATINAEEAWRQIRSGDIQQQLVVGEEAADIISAIWPEAKYAEDVMMVIGFIIALRQAGFWAPARPEDPAMEHAAGPQTGATPQMRGGLVIAPGGTPSDPYAFDKR